MQSMEQARMELFERLTAAREGDSTARQQLWDDYAPLLEVIARRKTRDASARSTIGGSPPAAAIPVEARVGRWMRRLMESWSADPIRPDRTRPTLVGHRAPSTRRVSR
jgi:hypothetical protein